MVFESIADAIAVLIHKHQPILNSFSRLALYIITDLIPISHLILVSRENNSSTQDQQ
jgi:hypothetical protein